MRTTIDIPERTLKNAKAAAALQGRSLKKFVVEAIEERLRTGTSRPRRRASLPLVPSRKPAAVRLTNDRIGRILEEEDAAPPA